MNANTFNDTVFDFQELPHRQRSLPAQLALAKERIGEIQRENKVLRDTIRQLRRMRKRWRCE